MNAAATVQDKEERLSMALERVQLALLEMPEAGDIHDVLKVVYEELQSLLPAVNACSIQVVDVEGDLVMSYQISKEKLYDHPMRGFSGSAVGVAWREQRVVCRPDLAADDPYDEAWSLHTDDLYGLQVRAVVDVPFRQGTLAVNGTSANCFAEEDIEILRKVARLLERSLDPMAHPDARERANLVKDNVFLREQNCLLTVFYDIAQLMLTSPDLDRALDTMVEEMTQAGIFHRLLVALVDAQTRVVKVVRYAGRLIRDQAIIGYECSLDERHALAEAARAGDVLMLGGQDGRRGWWPGSPEDDENRVSYFLPIRQNGQSVMVVVTDSRIDEEDEMVHKLRTLQSLLSQVLINIEYARLYAEAQTRATELARANALLEREIAERRRSEEARAAAERELEEQRVLRMHSDRLRSLGEMATGIAHELNQPLVGIRGLAEHMLLAKKRGWTLTEERIQDNLNLVVDQADRMTHIIDHVRMFAREAGRPEVYPVQVNEVVRSAVGLLGTQFHARGIELRCDLDDSLPEVPANPFSLEEVIINLMINARDAVEEGCQEAAGRRTAEVLLRTSLDPDGPGRRLRIEVIDRGAGIPEHLLSRIFDPFFTTKDLAKGTGLGLSISRSIVEQYGGTIRAQSTPGEGTTFTVAVPVNEPLERTT